MQDSYPLYVGNAPLFREETLTVTDKYTQHPVATVSRATPDLIDTAIDHAVHAAPLMRALPSHRRRDVLMHCVDRIQERFNAFADVLCIEAGKPIKDARGEVTRLIDTFRHAAEESVRLSGEVLDLEISPRAEGYTGMWKPVPIGPVSFISPFNFPLNLVAHKIAPAIAVGCPFVLKPASLTPIGALMIGDILAETDLPKGAFSILPCRRNDAVAFTTDPRLKLLSFTGSQDVGWDLKSKAGQKKVTLELGGNAACIVDEDAHIEDAVSRCIVGAFYQSGQSCVSVQRIYVHDRIYDAFEDQLLAHTRTLIHGDPKQEETFIGPMITEKEAQRVEQWVAEAVQAGGTLLCGGTRSGAMMQATLLRDVPHRCAVVQEEVFGPVAVLQRFTSFDDALHHVNDSRFGLQAGAFTRDIYKVQKAWDMLEVGGVIIGDVPSWRVDHMPYGGVKDSGLGREGIRYSMKSMTEMRFLAIRRPPN